MFNNLVILYKINKGNNAIIPLKYVVSEVQVYLSKNGFIKNKKVRNNFILFFPIRNGMRILFMNHVIISLMNYYSAIFS